MQRIFKCLLFAALISGAAGEARALEEHQYNIEVQNLAWFNVRFRPTVIAPANSHSYGWSNTIYHGKTGTLSFPSFLGPDLLQVQVEIEYSNGLSWIPFCTETFRRTKRALIQTEGTLVSEKKCSKFTGY